MMENKTMNNHNLQVHTRLFEWQRDIVVPRKPASHFEFGIYNIGYPGRQGDIRSIQTNLTHYRVSYLPL